MVPNPPAPPGAHPQPGVSVNSPTSPKRLEQLEHLSGISNLDQKRS